MTSSNSGDSSPSVTVAPSRNIRGRSNAVCSTHGQSLPPVTSVRRIRPRRGSIGQSQIASALPAVSHPALDFLQTLRPDGPWTLSRLAPGTPTATFTPGMEPALVEWLGDGVNVCYHLGVGAEHANRKLRKADVVRSDCLFVDIDPEDGQDADSILQDIEGMVNAGHVPAPTFTIRSGRGVHLIWKLREPVELEGEELGQGIRDVESRCRWLARMLGGDSTSDVSRMFRLPGTINLKDSVSREVVMSEQNQAAVYTLDDFQTVNAPAGNAAGDDWTPRENVLRYTIEEIRERLHGRLTRGLQQRITQPLERLDDRGNRIDRSVVVYRVARALLRISNFDRDFAFAVLSDPQHGISRKAREKFDREGSWRWLILQINTAVASIHTRDQEGRARSEAIQPEQRTPLRSPPDQNSDGTSTPIVGATSAPQPAPAVRQPEEQALADEMMQRVLVLGNGRISCEVDSAIQRLTNDDDEFGRVYVRGSKLVHPVRNVSGALRITLMNAETLAYKLSTVVHCVDQRMNPKEPSERLCRTILKVAPQKQILPQLTGVVEAPTITPEGRIIDRPGYDRQTGLLFNPGDATFPQAPDSPTRENALAAIETLHEPFRHFSFASEADRSVAISCVLSALVCRTIRAIPMFGFTAAKMSSGKTLLATIANYVAAGSTPSLVTHTQDQAEERKRLLSALIENVGMLVIDNVTRELKSDALCTMLTEPRYSDRLLGTNTLAEVETNVLFAATGNNLRFAGDLSTRALLCRLNSTCERPEERTFEVNLHQWVPANRGRLVAAALTIMKAYFVAGQPVQPGSNFARFENWQQLCRFPLIWLGMADPCDTRREIEDTDPIRNKLLSLLSAWYELFQDEAKSCSEVVATAESFNTTEGVRELREALELISPERGNRLSRVLGCFLRDHKDRIEGEFKFEKATTSHGNNRFRMVRVGSTPTTCGDARGTDDGVE